MIHYPNVNIILIHLDLLKRCFSKNIFSQNILPSGGFSMVISLDVQYNLFLTPLVTNVGHASGLGTRPGAKAALPGLGNIRLPEEFWWTLFMRFLCLFVVCLLDFLHVFLYYQNIEQLFNVFFVYWCLQCALWVLFDRVVKKWYHLHRLHMTYNLVTNESAGTVSLIIVLWYLGWTTFCSLPRMQLTWDNEAIDSFFLILSLKLVRSCHSDGWWLKKHTKGAMCFEWRKATLPPGF